MNRDKTKIICIGSKHNSKYELRVSERFSWESSDFTLLELYFYNKFEIPKINDDSTLNNVQQELGN